MSIGMNLSMPARRLTQLIAEHADTALNSRQLAKRLSDLLPLRLKELRRQIHLSSKLATKERLVLISAAYRELVTEVVEMAHLARQARIQYETHLMLFQARQSLQSLTKVRREKTARSSSATPGSDRIR